MIASLKTKRRKWRTEKNQKAKEKNAVAANGNYIPEDLAFLVQRRIEVNS